MNPFRVLKIDHIVLRCARIASTMDFYCQTLGFEVAKRNEPLGLIHLRSEGAMIDLIALDGPLGRAGGAEPGREGRNLDHLCLRVDPFDPDVLTRYFQDRGIAVTEIKTRFGGEGDGPSFYIHDPEGNQVEIKGPAIRA
jgi:catechol 2,3-dioxygenase-like lactoylglutathione lyase family enzyme